MRTLFKEIGTIILFSALVRVLFGGAMGQIGSAVLLTAMVTAILIAVGKYLRQRRLDRRSA